MDTEKATFSLWLNSELIVQDKYSRSGVLEDNSFGGLYLFMEAANINTVWVDNFNVYYAKQFSDNYFIDDLKVLVNGEEEYQQFTAGDVSTEIRVVNYSETEVPVSIAVAQYNAANHTLKNIAIKNISIPQGEQIVKTSLEVDTAENSYIKVITLNGLETMKPLKPLVHLEGKTG